MFLTAEHLEEVGWEVPFHERIQFLNSERVSCHPLVALYNCLDYGIPQLREGKPQ
ncbi:hypothetical protein KR49_13280 [Synechococcus sp. KORDI-49]|nr:hypothetical protein KR49_13280 [Synechococcus sp. KORDI-49]